MGLLLFLTLAPVAMEQTKHHHVGLHEGGTTVIRHCSLTINLFKPPVKSLPLSLQGERRKVGLLLSLTLRPVEKEQTKHHSSTLLFYIAVGVRLALHSTSLW
jgi:hypothetical protein